MVPMTMHSCVSMVDFSKVSATSKTLHAQRWIRRKLGWIFILACFLDNSFYPYFWRMIFTMKMAIATLLFRAWNILVEKPGKILRLKKWKKIQIFWRPSMMLNGSLARTYWTSISLSWTIDQPRMVRKRTILAWQHANPTWSELINLRKRSYHQLIFSKSCWSSVVRFSVSLVSTQELRSGKKEKLQIPCLLKVELKLSINQLEKEQKILL